MEDNVTDRIVIGRKPAMRHAFGDDGDVAGLNALLQVSPNFTTLHQTQQRADAALHVDESAAGDHSAGARNYKVESITLTFLR